MSSIPPIAAHSVRTDTSKLNSLERDVKILSCSKYTWMIIVAEIADRSAALRMRWLANSDFILYLPHGSFLANLQNILKIPS